MTVPHFLNVWFAPPYLYVAMPFWAWTVVSFLVSVGLGTFVYLAVNGRGARVVNLRCVSVLHRLLAQRVS